MAGDAPNPSTDVISLYNQYWQHLPGLLGITAGQEKTGAQGLLDATKATTPGYNQLALDQIKQFAPQFAGVGNELNRSNALSAAQTNADILKGPGAEAARSANSLDRETNPELYSARTATGNKLGELYNSINLNGLSGGERAEVERSLNQSNTATGNLGLDNATNAVSNAMNFGNALNVKRGQLNSALGTGAGVINSLQNPTNSASVALAPTNNTANPGLGVFSPITQSTPYALPFGQSALGTSGGIFNSSIGPRAQSSAANSPMGLALGSSQVFSNVLSGAGGASCCFIFMEAYNGILPPHVRFCRDLFYSLEPSVAKGYKRMAKWLVPLMRQSKILRAVVNETMIKPLSKYGAYLCDIDNTGKKYRVIKNFWFNIWKHYGKCTR